MFTNIALEFPNIMTSIGDLKLSAILSCQNFQSMRNCVIKHVHITLLLCFLFDQLYCDIETVKVVVT